MGTNTSIGIGIGIPFKNNALGGDRPYLPPELKARLIGVWDNYGKKNTDADRNIIKNKIHNAGGDLEILNSAYRLNSGFGEYSNDFQEYTYSENVVVKDNTNAIFNSRGKLLVPYSYLTKDIPSFKIKVSGLVTLIIFVIIIETVTVFNILLIWLKMVTMSYLFVIMCRVVQMVLVAVLLTMVVI